MKLKLKKSMKVRDIETQHPETVGPDAQVMQAAQIMQRLDVGVLPVCDGERLVGVVTDRDITLRSTAEGRDPKETPVRDVMSINPICCHEDQDVAECVELMEQKQIRRLPVVDNAQRLVGIVSLGDLAIRSRNERLAGEVLNRVSAQPLPAVQ
ncbi:MAG TPA: CBS domain-containing protein [Verrucomicrobiae bacterium]|nr:CBS domain-containing protein [Verrucomicrobiae bacterium]